MSFEAEKLLLEKFSRPLSESQKRHVLVWYDEEETFKEEIKDYKLGEVKVIEGDNHQYFHSKYMIEEKHKGSHILLYLPIKKPPHKDNPILDILLYSQEFHMDSTENIMEELKLKGSEWRKLVQANQYFFRNKQRRQKFQQLTEMRGIGDEVTFSMTILATLSKASSNKLSAILYQLFSEWANDSRELWEELIKYGEIPFFWNQVYLMFGYKNEMPTIADLCLSIFKTKLKIDFANEVPKNWQHDYIELEINAEVFINQWMNQKNQEAKYRQVAEKVAKVIYIDKFIKRKPYGFFGKSDVFIEFDVGLLAEITTTLLQDGFTYSTYELILQSRRNTFWYEELENQYKALLNINRFFQLSAQFENQHILMGTLEELWRDYKETYYLIDTYYRKGYFYLDHLENLPEDLWQLKDKMEDYYHNGFLSKMSNRWSDLLEGKKNVEMVGVEKQVNFYRTHPQKYVENNQRVFVIISDALRYDIGVELYERLGNHHKFDVSIKEMQCTCPSYTALGMAALLPHNRLTINDFGEILVDDYSSKGTVNRSGILNKSLGELEGIGMQVNEFLKLNRDDSREMLRGKRLVYLYHNRIDACGEHFQTEDYLFGEVQQTIDELSVLIQRLSGNLSATNIYVTADHGFLYTRDKIDEHNKISFESRHKIIGNRRFVLVREQETYPNCLTFEIPEITNEGCFVHIPRGEMRFATQGGGSKFVHGGATIQELMIPLIKIKTERGASEKRVEIQLLTSLDEITSTVTYLEFLQVQPVNSMRKASSKRVYLRDKEGELISNELLLICDSRNTEASSRVMVERLVLFNQQYEEKSDFFLVIEDEHNTEISELLTVEISLPKIQRL